MSQVNKQVQGGSRTVIKQPLECQVKLPCDSCRAGTPSSPPHWCWLPVWRLWRSRTSVSPWKWRLVWRCLSKPSGTGGQPWRSSRNTVNNRIKWFRADENKVIDTDCRRRLMIIRNDVDNRASSCRVYLSQRQQEVDTHSGPLLRMLRCSACVCLCTVMCECGGRTTGGKDQWHSVRMHSWRAPSSITWCCSSQVCVRGRARALVCAWHRKDWEHRRTSLSSIHSSCICFQRASALRFMASATHMRSCCSGNSFRYFHQDNSSSLSVLEWLKCLKFKFLFTLETF